MMRYKYCTFVHVEQRNRRQLLVRVVRSQQQQQQRNRRSYTSCVVTGVMILLVIISCCMVKISVTATIQQRIHPKYFYTFTSIIKNDSNRRTSTIRNHRKTIIRYTFLSVLDLRGGSIYLDNTTLNNNNNTTTTNSSTSSDTSGTIAVVETSSPIQEYMDSSDAATSTTRSMKFQKECDDRAIYVKDLLLQRYQHVQSGKRMKDLCTFMKQQNKLYTNPSNGSILVPTTNITTRNTNEPNSTISSSYKLRSMNHNKHNPFPIDCTSLNFEDIASLTQEQQEQQPVNCFIDSTGEMSLDVQPPTIWQLGIRFVHLCINFAPVWSTMGIALCSQQFRQQYWYKWMTRSIGMSGAAWIKWGQWSATRSDIFPDTLCDQLSTLHASAPAHPWSYSALTIEQSLGLGTGTLHCVFDHCDTQPIASGSIAQVHRAILCGQPVAIKVRHPNVRQLMELDFRLMTIAATIMDKLPALSWLHIRESVDQFSHTISAQAHLQIEAHHLEVLNFNFRNWPRVSFPKPIFASSSMIIETFESGKITTDVIDKYNSMANILNRLNYGNVTESDGVMVIEAHDESEISENISNATNVNPNAYPPTSELISGADLMPMKLAKFLVTTGVSLYLKMLLIDNLMHADLHPGNIMVDIQYHQKDRKRLEDKHQKQLITLSDQSKDEDLLYHDVLSAMDDATIDTIRITLVDAGMVVKLTDEESSAFIGLLSSLGEGNGNEAAEYTLHFSVQQENMTTTQKQYFAADMVELFQERCRGYGTNVDVGHVLRGILTLIRKHRVRIDANFATLVINCLCIESLARRVCPTYNVLDAGRPLLQGYRRFANQQKGERPVPSPWFALKMSLNAFKKALDDHSFFRKEAVKKDVIQRAVAQQVFYLFD